MKEYKFNKDDIVYVNDIINYKGEEYTIGKLLCKINNIDEDKLILKELNDDKFQVEIKDRTRIENDDDDFVDNLYLVYYKKDNEYFICYETDLSKTLKKDEKKDNNSKPQFLIGELTSIDLFDSKTGEKIWESISIPSDKIEIKKSLDIDKKKIEKEEIKIPTPKEIKDYLDQYVIGQEEAKILLSTAVHNHYLRINNKDNNDVELQKSNILMIGNSGTGKTLLAETIAKYLDVPFAIINATEFSPTGIVGKSAEDIIQKLVDAADGNIEKAEKGIIYIDEFDKVAQGGISNKQFIGSNATMGKEVQGTFLKLLEGTEVDCETGGYYGQSKKVNTKNILFICGGAFAGIEKLLEKDDDIEQHVVGFNVNNSNKVKRNKKESENIIDKIGQKEIIKYGFTPEIIGRLPIIVKLNSLKVEELIQILTKPKNALIKQYQKILEMDGIKVSFNKKALEYIAKLAIDRQIGARGLRSIIEPYINKIQFNAPDDGVMKKYIIDDKMLKKNILPDLKNKI